MFCRECGAKIPDDSSFCFRCGSSTALPAGSPVTENVKNKSESPKAGTEKPNENKGKGSFGVIDEYNQKIQARQKKKRLFLLIGISILLLAIMVLIISFQTLNNKDDDAVSTQTEVEEPHNTAGNTPANAVNRGIATIQNKTVYYMEIDGNDQVIKSMDINGGSEVTEYTLDSAGSGLNIIAERLYFVTYDLDEEAKVTESHVDCLTIGASSPQEIYSTAGNIDNLFVAKNNIYFIESYADGDDKLNVMNIYGGDLHCILSEENLYAFSLCGSFLYYEDNTDAVMRCDLSGDHIEKVYSVSNGGCTDFCVTDEKLYVALFQSGNTEVRSMDLDGSNDTQIFESDKALFINSLNVVNNVIYYIEDTVSEDFEDFSDSVIYCRNLDGSNQKTVATSEEGVSQLSICDQWAFYYDLDTGLMVKIKLSTI